MENDAKKPIKRSAEMAVLSREHHEGLLLVWKIRQGIKKKVVEKRIADYVNWFWRQHLLAHFNKEEELLPHVLPSQHPLMQQMFAEHVQIKNLEQDINDDCTTSQLEAFADALNDHIRFEERVLFNEIEKTASDEQVHYLAQHLKDVEQLEKWSDEFWLNTTP